MNNLTQDRWIGVLLTVLVLAVFYGVAGNGFVNYDDQLYVTQNDHVQAGLTRESILWAFSSACAANWHPLTMLSHMLDWQVYGLQPTGHHLTSLFFHLSNTLLLFLLLRETTGRRWESAVVAALFGIHPLHVESVAWISERKDVLSGFFGILTLVAYARYARNPNIRRYMVPLFFFALGLLSKPMLVTLPLIMFLFDFWPLGRLRALEEAAARNLIQKMTLHRRHLQRLILEKVPFLILSLLSGIVTLIVQSGAMSTLAGIPMGARISNAMVSYQRYLEKTFWPDSLAIFYPYSFSPLSDHHVIGAAFFLVLATIAVVALVRRHPYIGIGWLWFLITLLPVIGIIQVGLQSMADRYMYLPSIGVFIMIVWGISSFSREFPFRRLLLSVVSVIVLVSLSVVAWQQVGYWKDTKTLFQRAADVTSFNWMAHRLLGSFALAEGDLVRAEKEMRRALSIWPTYADAHVGMAGIMEKRNRLGDAMVYLQKALQYDRKNTQAYIQKGNVLRKQGKKEQALASYAVAEVLIPDNSWTRNRLGVAFTDAGDLDRALAQFKRALALAPHRAETNNNIGGIFNLKDQPREALPYVLAAIKLKPNYPEAYNNAGISLQKTGNLEKAAYYFSGALLLKPDYEEARTNLRQLAARIANQPLSRKRE